jgi:hypothetical protein
MQQVILSMEHKSDGKLDRDRPRDLEMISHCYMKYIKFNARR